MRKGRLGVIAALAVAATAAAAVHFGERPASESAKIEPASAADRPAAPKSAGLEESFAASRGLPAAARVDLFASARPQRAPVKNAPVAVAPSQPTTPAFPYRYAGRVDQGGVRQVYLQKGNQLIAVAKGAMLDGVWRVDALSEDRIEVSFVPGGEQFSFQLSSLIGGATAQEGVYTSEGSAVAIVPALQTAPASPAYPQPTGTSRAEPSFRAGAAPLAAQATAAMPSQNASAGPGSSGAVPTGQLGADAPRTGSMPLNAGPARSGSMPTSSAPTGKKLGVE